MHPSSGYHECLQQILALSIRDMLRYFNHSSSNISQLVTLQEKSGIAMLKLRFILRGGIKVRIKCDNNSFLPQTKNITLMWH